MAGSTSPSPSIEGNPLSDDLILDAPISSNLSSSPGGADTHASPSPKIPSPKAVPVDSVVLSPEEGTTGSDAAGMTVVSPVVTKVGTDASHKDGSDFSSENLFEGALTESKEGTSNILQSEAKTIEGFITALGAREKDVGGESPSVEECRPGGVGGQSTVSNLIEAQRRGTEEIKCLTMLVSQKDAEIAILKASQSSVVPGALLDLQEENAHLKSANASLKNQLEELTRQMICDQRATNERINKLLAKL
ncbi:hypothetical protein HAX54_014968 [Datura stramonium]|uniref:Uncharacterized protein n=1 Tax=Datura stramonium TaxID=4076 RepID=A0ABS8TRR7_DATST|nr:hypothetical protein [Datura stramonium]